MKIRETSNSSLVRLFELTSQQIVYRQNLVESDPDNLHWRKKLEESRAELEEYKKEILRRMQECTE